VIGGAIVLLIFVKSILVIYRTKYAYKLVMDIRRYWMTVMMDKYMRSSYSYLVSSKQGVLLNNLLSEPMRATKGIDLMTNYVSQAFIAAYLYVLLFVVNWKITLIITVFMVLFFLIANKVTTKYSFKVGQKRIKFNQQMTSTAAESISAIRQIKTFSMEEEASSEFDKIVTSLNQLNIRFRVIQSLPKPFLESIIVTGTIGVLLYMAYVTKVNLISIIPILGLFVVAGQRLFVSVSFLVTHRMGILSSLPSLKLVHDNVTHETDREFLERGKEFRELAGDITIEDVTFGYRGRKILFDKLNMVIPLGKMTAIVGPSGSGKSTIADLLLGFYVPQEGRICIDDTNLSDLNLLSWRRKVGFVSQETFIFNTTIKKNILIGKPGATDEEVVEAAKQANADEFICDLPKGYETVVGERGVRLSGGQRQRIAIARAIVRDPEFLVFDEATSSLDTKTERLIQKSIESLGSTKTVLCITHRISAIENADLVYKIEEGRIVGAGSFGEVLGKKVEDVALAR
jgi:subfamily B ATP-binding cassette protein MsbA